MNWGLKEFGHTVTVCHDGNAGWKILQDEPFDLLILDIIMPKINGLELCRLYRQTFGYQSPVIMLTAKVEDGDKIMGLSVADDYITKPFNPLEVVARVKAQLRQYMRYKQPGIKQEAEPHGIRYPGV